MLSLHVPLKNLSICFLVHDCLVGLRCNTCAVEWISYSFWITLFGSAPYWSGSGLRGGALGNTQWEGLILISLSLSLFLIESSLLVLLQ